MDFPLFVGKRWTSTRHYGTATIDLGPGTTIGDITIPRLDTIDLFTEYISEVVAFEQVTTRVGTLDAYRILRIAVTSQQSVVVMMVWYSPEARAVVKLMVLTPNTLGPDLELHEYRLTGARGP
jgi:hypothetical protein